MRKDDFADYLYFQSLALEDENSQQDYEDRLLALSAIIIVGANETRERRITRQNRTRRYLCRPQLPPEPRENTPWQALYKSRSDRAFITTMGFIWKSAPGRSINIRPDLAHLTHLT
jgi:hypothetical protein